MSEPWSQLTADEVLGEFTPQEAATLKNIQQAVDRLPDIVTRVTEAVRDAYRSGGRELDAEEGLVPTGLKSRAIAIARWKLLLAFPQLKALQTPDRKAAHDNAQDYLDQIARREIKGPGSAEIVSQQTRVASRDKLSGL